MQVTSTEGTPRPRLTILLGAICAFLACCSKESGTAVLLLIPLINGFERWRFGSADPPGSSANSRSVGASRLWPYLGLAIAATVYLGLRYAALGGQLYQPVTPTRTVNVLVDATFWPRICGALQLWGLYWLKTVWPQILCITYSIQAVAPAYTPFAGPALLGLTVLLALVGWSIFKWRRGLRLPAVLTAALLISYLPMSNTVVLIKVYLAERAWYLPSIWIAVLVGSLLGGIWARHTERPATRRWTGPATMAMVMLLVAAGLARCWDRNAEWRDEGTLYAAAYRDHPEAIVALVQYGQWLAQADRQAEGISLLHRATQMDPGFTDAQRLLGAAYLAVGMVDPAFEHLQTADVQIPGHPWTQRLLARAQLARSTSRADRVAQAERAVQDQPNELEAWMKLADELIGVGQSQAAVEHLLQVEERFTDVGAYHRRLADALLMSSRRQEGIARYRQAVHLEPNNAAWSAELAAVLLDRRADGDVEEARRLIDRAYASTPRSIAVRLCRAELLTLDNHPAEAAALYRSVAADLPPDSDLRRTCEMRARALGP